jgi:putative endonuclease
MLKALNTRLRGKTYEIQAEHWLVAQGLRPLARNFTARGGELDLIMEDGPALVFVEVRFRASNRFVGALESVTASKQRRVLHAAACWLQRNPAQGTRPCRFDVVGIEGVGESCRIAWIKAAFTA